MQFLVYSFTFFSQLQPTDTLMQEAITKHFKVFREVEAGLRGTRGGGQVLVPL